MALPTPESSNLIGGGNKFASIESIERQNSKEDLPGGDVVDSDAPDNDNIIDNNKHLKKDDDKKEVSNIIVDESQKNFKSLSEVENGDEDTEEEEENENSEVVESEEEEDDDNSENGLEDTFSFLKNNDLLLVPDDFKFDGTKEGLDKALLLDKELREERTMQEIESKIKDERIFELINAGINGGEFLDLEKIFQMSKTEIEYDKLDLTNPGIAKDVLNKYYTSAGLNEKLIKRNIQRAEEEESLEEEAKDALEHLKKQSGDKKASMIKEAEVKNKDKQIKQQKFEQDLITTVKEKKFAPEHIKSIATLLSPIIDKNTKELVKNKQGENITYYDHIIDTIKTNPKHLVELLTILTNYDLEKGFEKQQKQEVKKEESKNNKNAFDELNKIGQKRKQKGSSTNGTEKPKYTPKPKMMTETE